MHRNLLGYEDAVKLLGGESKIITALSQLAGIGLVTASMVGIAHGNAPIAIGLFELKDEATNLSQEVLKTLRRRLTGLHRFKRSELLEAAHAILIVGAFFAAFDDLDQELGTALNSEALQLHKNEQAAIVLKAQPRIAGLAELARELITPGRIPGLDTELTRPEQLAQYYATLAHGIARFAAGTAAWDQCTETTRDRWGHAITTTLPSCALNRYEEQVIRFSAEFPEFAFWAYRVGVRAILHELRATRQDANKLDASLQATTALLTNAAYGPAPDSVRAHLVARYHEQIAKPIAGAVGTFAGQVKLPALQELYVTPACHLLPNVSAGIDNAQRDVFSSTASADARPDTGVVVLEHLISSQAARVPLVVLGQPGAGKSVFTQMLAAGLDSNDYLVVRVELRSVASDTGIQQQIEGALENLTGTPMHWSTLADSAGNAQPVIILDGFDELLQASGVSHFDFLERIQEFQEREAELNRPVAVIVTSRIAVANQVRYPLGTPVIQLDAFDANQVKRWLTVWNRVNTMRPLTVETALKQHALSHQPLLLFLLALFYSGGGDLSPSISQARLFDRLFTDFVERDVAKLDSHLAVRQQQHAVERDLDNLSMVAFAMFNRGRQSVTEVDLITDLTALYPDQPGKVEAGGRSAAISIADRMAGRFFFRLFVHKDEAIRGHQALLSTYEFLHAAFGEFLVGRWIVGELIRFVEQTRRSADDAYPQPLDDAKLYALLSVTVISAREQRVLGFVEDLLAEVPDTQLSEIGSVVNILFNACLLPRLRNPFPQYQPIRRAGPAFSAAYSANLLLLLLVITKLQSRSSAAARGRLSIADIQILGITNDSDLAAFYAVSRLWHAQLTKSEWESLLDSLSIDLESTENAFQAGPGIRLWTGRSDKLIRGQSVLSLNRDHSDIILDDRFGRDTPAGHAFREAALLGCAGYRDLCLTVLPYLSALGVSNHAGLFQTGDLAVELLAFLLPSSHLSSERRAESCISLFSASPGVQAARLLLDRVREDMRLFSWVELVNIVAAASPSAWGHICAYLDVVSFVYSSTEKRAPTADEFAAIKIDLTTGRNDPMVIAPRDLQSLLTMLEPPDLFASAYERSSIDLRESADIFRLLDPHNYFALDSYGDSNDMARYSSASSFGQDEMYDLMMALGLSDLLGLHDPKDLLDPRDLIQLPGGAKPESREQRKTEKRFIGSWINAPTMYFALSVNVAERGLPRYATLAGYEDYENVAVAKIEQIAPGFFSRARGVASEYGAR